MHKHTDYVFLCLFTVLKAAAGTVKGGCAMTCTAQQCGMGYFYIFYTLSPGSFALWHHTANKTLGEVEKDLAVTTSWCHGTVPQWHERGLWSQAVWTNLIIRFSFCQVGVTGVNALSSVRATHCLIFMCYNLSVCARSSIVSMCLSSDLCNGVHFSNMTINLFLRKCCAAMNNSVTLNFSFPFLSTTLTVGAIENFFSYLQRQCTR